MMPPRRLFLVLLVAVLALATVVKAALTPEEKRIRKEKAAEADRSIRFIPHAEMKERTKDGVWMIMFGASWCPYTQKATPMWLDFQKLFDSKHDSASRTLNIAKVECGENEAFCTNLKIEGYPTYLLYVDGNPREEYTGDDSPADWLAYLEGNHAQYVAKGKPAEPVAAAPPPPPELPGAPKKKEEVKKENEAKTPEVPAAAAANKKAEVVQEPEKGNKVAEDKAKDAAAAGGSLGTLTFLCFVVVVGIAVYRFTAKRGRPGPKIGGRDRYRPLAP
ncbi:hypothetical protein HDU96_009227 [Phlyctochytrium bullatum]|nr:hypothetical protein HDU96_009227 [Phlyctochytrium bullatum]